MKKPGLSVGSIVMMLVTAFVVVGMAAFLSLIAGDDVYERTRAVFGNLAEQTAERETAEPTVSPTKTRRPCPKSPKGRRPAHRRRQRPRLSRND